MEPPRKPKFRQRVGAWVRRAGERLSWFSRRPKPIEKKPLPPNGLRILFFCNAGVTSSEVEGNVYRHWQKHPPGFPVTVNAIGHITSSQRGSFMEQVRRADLVIPIIGHDNFGIRLDIHERGRNLRSRKETKEIRRKRLEWYKNSAPELSLNMGQHNPAEVAQRIEDWVSTRYILPGKTFVPTAANLGLLRQLWERTD